MDPNLITAFAQWGPLGLIVGFLLWDGQKSRAQAREDSKCQHEESKETQERLIQVVSQNSGAMQTMAESAKATTVALDRVTTTLQAVDSRLVRLEEQHRLEGVR
jgi:hypothetical protein